MAEIEIGRGKSARRGVELHDLSIVPTRRTRDIDDVDVSWKIDAYRFDLPFIGAGIDAVVTADDAVALGERGALALIDLDALWAETPDAGAVAEHVATIKNADVRVAVSVSGARAEQLAPHAMAAEANILVIQDPVISAETVSATGTTLNLKTFIRNLDIPVVVGGCASYAAALHLMRTGAAGVLVGVDQSDLGIAVPLASAIGDVRSARVRHLDETGVYCHLIARGRIETGAQVAKAVACGADAVMVDAAALLGTDNPGDDIVDDLRQAMAICGYTSLKAFQKAELVIR